MSQAPRSAFSVVGSFERYMENVPAAFAVTSGTSHIIVYANAAFRSLVSLDGTRPLGVPISGLFSETDARTLVPLLDRAYRTGVVSRNRSLQPIDDHVHPLRCTVWPDVGGVGGTAHLLLEIRPATPGEVTLALRPQVAEQLLMSALREHDAATLAHTSWRGAAFLAAESRRLSASLDEVVTLDAMRRMSIPHLGAWCIVDMLDASDAMQRLAIIHPDPAKQEILDSVNGSWNPKAGDSFGLPAALRSGEEAVVVEGPDATRAAARDDSIIISALSSLGVSSLLTVPLIIDEKTRGAITFVGDRLGSHISVEDIELAKNLADQGALALERARLHGEAVTLQNRAESANEAKNAFLGMMSHELRTPLSAISGYVDLLLLELRGPITAEQRRDLDRIHTNQRHLTRIIDELLSLAAARGGHLALKFETMAVADILTTCSSMLEPLLHEKGLNFAEHSCSPSLLALADREKVMQILVNLVSNSIKFTPQGGSIWLDADATSDSILIRVFDTGIGIAAEKLDTIFEPFIQLSNGIARTESGIGLGLAISRDLSRAMHGDLTVESRPGSGSTFTLTLPRAGVGDGEGMSPDTAMSAAVALTPEIHREL